MRLHAPSGVMPKSARQQLPVRPDGLRVLIGVKNRAVGEALAVFLLADQRVATVELALTGRQAVKAAAHAHPEVVLLELSLVVDNDEPGLLEDIHASHPGLRVLLMGHAGDPALVSRALHRGADGFVGMNQGPQMVLEALDRVAVGQVALPGSAIHDVLGELRLLRQEAATAFRILRRLSGREFEVLVRLTRGQGTQQIAVGLGVSVSTVRTHLTHVRSKLAVHTQVQAAARGQELLSAARGALTQEAGSSAGLASRPLASARRADPGSATSPSGGHLDA